MLLVFDTWEGHPSAEGHASSRAQAFVCRMFCWAGPVSCNCDCEGAHRQHKRRSRTRAQALEDDVEQRSHH